MKKPTVCVSVVKRLPDIVQNPIAIASLQNQQHVMFNGVECVVHTAEDDTSGPIFKGGNIWFTTADSRIEEYNAAMHRLDEQFGYGCREGAPRYRDYIKHIRMPHHVVMRECVPASEIPPDAEKFSRAVNSRELFIEHIAECKIG